MKTEANTLRHTTLPCGLVAAVVLALAASALAQEDVRTLVQDGPDGSRIEHRRAGAAPAFPRVSPARRRAPAALAGGGGVVWERNVTDAIYTTTGLTMPTVRLAAGTWLNPPLETQVAPLDGTGDLDWTFPGTRFEVAASRDADVVASVDFVSALQRVTVRKWTVDSEVPDWSYDIEPASLASYRTVRVSADGSTIAVLVTNQGGEEIHAQVYYFDASSGVPLGVVDADPGSFARNLAVGEDGAFFAFIAAARIYVFDRDAGVVRFSGSTGGSNDPVTVSTDGSIIAYGWTSLSVREWNGTTYASLFVRGGAGRTLRQCAADASGETLVATWSSPAALQNRVELFDLPSATPIWTYDYELGSGTFQDVPSDLSITPNGSHIAVASWGDEFNTNPEVHVFGRAVPVPLLTADTPGSMFAIDLARAPGGVLRIAAAGKHIHANMSGRGGDLYSIILPTDCTADVDGDGTVAFSDLLVILSAWGPYEPCPPFVVADIDANCDVGFSDILAVLAAWGDCD